MKHPVCLNMYWLQKCILVYMIQGYRSNISLTLALDGGWWTTPCPSSSTAGKDTRYPSYKRLGGPHGSSGRVRKLSTLPEFEPDTVQPIASRSSDYATPPYRSVYIAIYLGTDTP